MSRFDCTRYQPAKKLVMTDRVWPDMEIKSAPLWCSVDLRDGNQALVEPMDVKRKLVLFQLLVEIGFKEIEVGFPAASKADFEFVRHLIEFDLIPTDVRIQVLTQARSEIIERTYEAVIGANKVTVHFYNPTSQVQRTKVFNKSKTEIIEIATAAGQRVLDKSKCYPDTDWRFQYAPESFTATEIEFSVEICDAVSKVLKPTPDAPLQITLPATVEIASPNIYADQIEWFCNNIKRRDSIIVSTHTHNDRGCAVAAAELALLAGAQRVEGTLLGNGERTGNMDIITLAMNLYSEGIEPNLDFSNMDYITKTLNECIQMEINPRHPYCGEFVFTAFSGGHQDAISKCLSSYNDGDIWDVAYLPIDPKDIGRDYRDIIRINSQSGKGGVCYVVKMYTGIDLPYWLQIDFSQHIQKYCDESQNEVAHNEVWDLFQQIYLSNNLPIRLVSYSGADGSDADSRATLQIYTEELHVEGNAIFEDCLQYFNRRGGLSIVVLERHSFPAPLLADCEYFSCVKIKSGNQTVFGVSVGPIRQEQEIKALLKAILNLGAFDTDEIRQSAIAQLSSLAL